MLISIRLYIQGDELDPSEITELLGVPPSRSHRRGELRALRGGRVAHERIGLWVWKAGDDDAEPSLDGLMDRLVAAFGTVVPRLSSLPNAESVRIDLHVVVDENDGKEVTLTMSPRSIEALHATGLPL
jgi:hypothetical protein